MLTQDYNNLMERLNLMIECELAVAEFYGKCSQAFEKDKSFWDNLAKEEAQHAKIITRLSEAVKKAPQQFQIGKSFPHAALKTFISGIRTNLEKLASGGITEHQAFIIARDIEYALIEQQYVQVIKTDNAEFQKEINGIMGAEHEHKRRVEEKTRIRA